MTRIEVSRRNLLATGACAPSASALGGQNLATEKVVRKW